MQGLRSVPIQCHDRPHAQLVTTIGFELTKLGSERERPVNFEGSVNERFREFWREIPGCGRNLEGPFRTPEFLSRNRERDADRRIVANPCQNWPETRNTRLPISRRRALTGWWFLSVEKKRAPRVGLETATIRLTAQHPMWSQTTFIKGVMRRQRNQGLGRALFRRHLPNLDGIVS